MRKEPTASQRRRLLKVNAGVCCVCKERHIGVDLHHIDGDSSNTVDENLAVLCVKDHDADHRPHAYIGLNHVDLGPERILEFKKSWEAFVAEAAKPYTQVVAVVNVFGKPSMVHSMKLVFQWQNGKIEIERVYHLLDGPVQRWIDWALDEVKWLGDGIKVVLIDKPLDPEYCFNCSHSFSHILDGNLARRTTDESWITDSLCSVYVNPTNPSLAISIALGDEVVYQGALHLCGQHLHYVCDNYEERKRLEKKRRAKGQVRRVVQRVLDEWQPAKVLIGTGNHDAPHLIPRLELPDCWERSRN